MKKFNVLFVCKANIGRSQALRTFTQKYLEEHLGLSQRMKVDSAGTDPGITEDVKNQPTITAGLKELYARAFGIEHDSAIRKPISPELLAAHELVLVAEPKLLKELHERFPEYAHKITTVKNYLWHSLTEQKQVIDDPPDPTTRRYGKKGKNRVVEIARRKKNYKMLRECQALSRRLVERWNRQLTQWEG